MRRPSPWYAAEKVIDWTPSLRLRRRVNDGRYSKVVLWFGQCSKMGHPLPRRETIRVAVVRRWAPTGCRSLCSKIRCRIKQSRERAANPPARSVSGRKPGGNSVVLGSVAETEGCLRTVVVWEGEAPAEPGCHSPPLLCTARMGHPRSTNSVMVGSAHPTLCPPHAAHPTQLRKNGAPAIDTPYGSPGGSPSRRPRRNDQAPVVLDVLSRRWRTQTLLHTLGDQRIDIARYDVDA
jgi:hypothetical protein